MNRNIIAILRGITPDEIENVANVILSSGIDKIEVPLNSPQAFDSIEILAKKFSGRGIFGAGTVLKEDEVQKLADIGAQMIVSPNCNPKIIEKTKALKMLSYPGVMTPTECFAALDAGADGLKFFPGDLVGPVGLKAMRAVLPKSTNCLAVGGASPENFTAWFQAGANGFGIGSAIYKAGDNVEDIAAKATEIVRAYDEALS